jgi:hypothetical protein
LADSQSEKEKKQRKKYRGNNRSFFYFLFCINLLRKPAKQKRMLAKERPYAKFGGG